MSDEKGLETQVEKAGLFTHSALSRHAERINRIEAFLYGLADALLESGQVTEEQLHTRTKRVAEELTEKGETLSGGVVLRVDDEQAPALASVDCAARMHVCKAVCCKLSFPLSAAEIEAGHVKWELGKPYFARKDEEAGKCVHLAADHSCGVYSCRPRVCSGYSCENDERIWKDFEKMILNEEWIEQHLRPERPRLVAIRMDRIR